MTLNHTEVIEPSMNPVQNITPKDLKSRIDNGEDIVLIDVREDWELDITRVDFAKQIVLQTIPERAELDIPKDKTVVMMCRSGGRSMQAAFFLIQNGWDANMVLNLEDGVLGWARDVDPRLPTNY